MRKTKLILNYYHLIVHNFTWITLLNPLKIILSDGYKVYNTSHIQNNNKRIIIVIVYLLNYNNSSSKFSFYENDTTKSSL